MVCPIEVSGICTASLHVEHVKLTMLVLLAGIASQAGTTIMFLHFGHLPFLPA
jgi:hypothetical protein